MPGYKPLPTFLSGNAADQVREAETHHRAGDLDAAVRLLEEALEASIAVRSAMPGWLCGRLAALYRTLRRYDDEVRLLERYRESQTTEDARTRYDARLSKARTIADRKRRPESKALESVRECLGRPRRRRVRASGATPLPPPLPTPTRISSVTLSALRDALGDGSANGDERRRDALRRLCDEARTHDAPVDELVTVLRAARDGNGVDPSTATRRQETYGAALVHLLALYFREEHDAAD